MQRKLQELRCVHRHLITEHPSCFSKGLVNYKDVKEFEKATKEPWYRYPAYRIAYLDIETDNLNADFGSMLTWAIKEKDGAVYYDFITKSDIDTYRFDSRIVQSCVETLMQYKIVMGYYSTGFDIPFLRAKALHYGFDFPGYGELYHWDLYYTVKSKLKISRKSLDNACDYLGIKGKTPIDKEVWRLAKYGDAEAIQEVLRHNVADVEITEKLHDKLDFTRKWIKTSI